MSEVLQKWIEAAVIVADAENMPDSEVIPTWPDFCVERFPDRYPQLTVGGLREWQANPLNAFALRPETNIGTVGFVDYERIASRAIADIARVTELISVSEEDAGRPIVELVLEFLADQGVEGDKWISVDDQLPDADLPVLVFAPGVDDYEIDFVDVCADTGDEWFANDSCRLVTHWLPMPKPPASQWRIFR